MPKYIASLLITIISLSQKYVDGTSVKRCANLFDESCINNGLLGSGTDENWITGNGNTPGKRNVLPKMYQQRCANLFDESCINNGLLGSGTDENWITGNGNTPGKRNVLPKMYQQRCANLFDENCINNGWLLGPGSTPGKRNLRDRISAILKGHTIPGKRCANLFDESCINGGIIGSGGDEEWLGGGGGPGRR